MYVEVALVLLTMKFLGRECKRERERRPMTDADKNKSYKGKKWC